jgi:hypothetical protein
MAPDLHVRGVTPEQREQKRRQRTARTRADHYTHLMTDAVNRRDPQDTLRHACDFLRAVANDMTPDAVLALAETVTRLADERNQP